MNNKHLLFVVPARGGSKGIPLKNLKRINGRTLIQIVGETIDNLPYSCRKIISSDHDLIIQEGRKYGLDSIFKRPDYLSGDMVSDYDVLIHALNESERYYQEEFDYIIMLQPTSPGRTRNDIEQALSLMELSDDSLCSVSPVDIKYHPLKQFTLKEGCIDFFDPRGQNIIARQQLDKTYIRNGIIYIISRNCLVNKGSIFGERIRAFIMEHGLPNIDTEEDLRYASNYFRGSI